MIPFFKQQLLNYSDPQHPEMDLGEQIHKTIESSMTSKLDKRVMKNIDYDFTLVPQLMGQLNAIHSQKKAMRERGISIGVNKSKMERHGLD
jgi:hypothetical protein